MLGNISSLFKFIIHFSLTGFFFEYYVDSCAIQQPNYHTVFLCISQLQLFSHYVRLPGYLICAKSWGLVVVLTPEDLLHLLENLLSPTTVKTIKGKKYIWEKNAVFRRMVGRARNALHYRTEKEISKIVGKRMINSA